MNTGKIWGSSRLGSQIVPGGYFVPGRVGSEKTTGGFWPSRRPPAFFLLVGSPTFRGELSGRRSFGASALSLCPGLMGSAISHFPKGSASVMKTAVGLVGRSTVANLKLLMAAALAASAAPAAAGVLVLGSSDARLCYEAADSPSTPTGTDIRRCDSALIDGNLSQYEIVATHVNRGILRLRRGSGGRSGGRLRPGDRARSEPARSLSQQGRGAAPAAESERGAAIVHAWRSSATRRARRSPIMGARSPTSSSATSARPITTIARRASSPRTGPIRAPSCARFRVIAALKR